jgi:hypothetical protein
LYGGSAAGLLKEVNRFFAGNVAAMDSSPESLPFFMVVWLQRGAGDKALLWRSLWRAFHVYVANAPLSRAPDLLKDILCDFRNVCQAQWSK